MSEHTVTINHKAPGYLTYAADISKPGYLTACQGVAAFVGFVHHYGKDQFAGLDRLSHTVDLGSGKNYRASVMT